MTKLSKVIWSEGMHLGPHHFQSQASYFESTVHFTASSLWYAGYGFAACQLDSEALRNGNVALTHASGFFADGLSFQIPESDPAPEPRAIAELFPATRDRLGVLLAVPQRKPAGGNCSMEKEGGPAEGLRYSIQETLIYDENTGADEKPVPLARKSLRLLFDTESTEDYETLPLAQVRRDGSGGFQFDERFIPPCLQMSTSDRLATLARSLVEILQSKSSALTTAARGRGSLQSGLSEHQVATFWFLHTINAALPALRHACFTSHVHPEELYSELLRLAGALCTFGLDSRPEDLPLYNHLDLQQCFEKLDSHIRRHLEILLPSNCIAIPLPGVRSHYYEADLDDSRCFGPSRWILSIRSELGESDLIRQTPLLVKVCSSQFVPELVRRAMIGLKLNHLEAPPAAVSPRVDYQYFSIERSGPCWDHLSKTKRIGVYVPGEIPAPRLELFVIFE
jgi:type VI secretion system protein ImpJ